MIDEAPNRQEINREILRALTAFNEANPNLRFGQILAVTKAIKYKDCHDMGPEDLPEVVDPFNEESSVTLNRIKGNK